MVNDRERLIETLMKTYCRLKPSNVHGIGVFAIQDIPEGVNPFRTVYPLCETIVELSQNEVSKFHPEVQKMIHDFFKRNEQNGRYPVLSNGLNTINISFYLNHSESPNLDQVEGTGEYYEFRTNRIVYADEELLIDYNADPS